MIKSFYRNTGVRKVDLPNTRVLFLSQVHPCSSSAYEHHTNSRMQCFSQVPLDYSRFMSVTLLFVYLIFYAMCPQWIVSSPYFVILRRFQYKFI